MFGSTLINHGGYMYVEYDEEGWGCYPENKECQSIQKQRQIDSNRESAEETEEFVLRANQPLNFS